MGPGIASLGGNKFSLYNEDLGRVILTADSAGNLGIGTTTPGSLLSVQSVGNFQAPTSTLYTGLIAPGFLATSTGLTITGGNILLSSGATSTANNGFNLSAGCFAINDTCVGRNADTLDTLDSGSFLRSDASDNYTSGTLTFDAGTTLAVNGLATFVAATSTDLGITDGLTISGSATSTWTGTGGISIIGGGALTISAGTSTFAGVGIGNTLLIGGTATTTIAGNNSTSTLAGGLIVDTSALIVDSFSNKIGIGTTTLTGGLTLDSSTNVANGIAGIYQNAALSHSSGAAFGNRLIVSVNNSAVATSEGILLRMLDNTSGFGDNQLVRGLEVQADRGNNTQGVNTGILSFGRTFGVQGVTSGTAAGVLVPAGVYAENQGTSTGAALRVYTSTTTTSDLVSFFQEDSIFTGTGLKMNFGKDIGSFTGNFLDLQINDASRFLVTSGGTTTIGNGIAAAGIQVGFGAICIDNDGSCDAAIPGRIYSVSQATGNSDLAENYFSDEALEPGDIVRIKNSPDGKKAYVGKSGISTTTDETILGVVSSKPGVVLGQRYLDIATTSANEAVYEIGLIGRVPVKISLENGNIRAGDKLTASSEPGVAMLARPGDGVIGYALEDYTGGAGDSAMIEEELRDNARIVRATTTSDGLDYSGGLNGDNSSPAEAEFTPGLMADAPTVHESYGEARIMMYVDVGKGRHLDITDYAYFMDRGLPAGEAGTSTPFWAIDQKTGEIKSGHFTDFRDSDIANVRSIISSSGTWSINENGKLVVREIETGKLKVGAPEAPTGVTLYDTASGEPYCLRITNGAPVSVPGECGNEVLPASGSTPLEDPELVEGLPPESPLPDSSESPPPEDTLPIEEPTPEPTPTPPTEAAEIPPPLEPTITDPLDSTAPADNTMSL